MNEHIAASKKDMLARYPFFGSLAASVEYVETKEIRTIGSDGRTIFYNPSYIESLSEEDRTFVLTHEICHIAFGHIPRGRGKDPEIWKNATDAVVNQLLKRDGMTIIKGGIDYPEAIDYDADSYYEILLEQKLEIELMEGQMDGAQTETGNEAVFVDGDDVLFDDEHLLWDEDIELPEELEDLIPRKAAKAGNDIVRDERPIEDIGLSKPILDWRLILRDTINYGVDWSLAHAEIEDGIVRPVLDPWPMPETEIVLDTSWSVEDSLLRNFLRECKNILQLSKLRVGCFDTCFYGFQDIRSQADIDNMIFQGGGGTDFNIAMSAFSRRVDNRIIFTDGKAPMPDHPLDAVWLVYGDETIEPDAGKVIYITDEQLEQLK